jgi:hypothetical protein
MNLTQEINYSTATPRKEYKPRVKLLRLKPSVAVRQFIDEQAECAGFTPEAAVNALILECIKNNVTLLPNQ